MEYLTLHEMPQRHMYNARRMATPDDLRVSERILPALPTDSPPFPKPPLPPPRPGTPTNPRKRRAESPEAASEAKPRVHFGHFDPSYGTVQLPSIDAPRLESRVDSLTSQHSSSSRLPLLALLNEPEDHTVNEESSQNHLTRHSPPVQPNEQQSNNVGLPSFSQLLKNVNNGEPSPPRTPNRNNGSTDGSPTGRSAQWEDVAWGGDGKRRRLDSSEGQYRPVYQAEPVEYEPRRPSAIDPVLTAPYAPSSHPAPTSHHHRPSLPFVPPTANLSAHIRHQSTPVPQAHTQYQHHVAPAHHSMSGPPGYPAHPGPYDRRPAYYPEPQTVAHGHPYDRPQPQNPYYAPQPAAYVPQPSYNPHIPPQPYSSYTFQSALGVDQNSFNRKRRGNLPKEATATLKKWFSEHRESPYPTEDEKLELCAKCGLSLNQVSNWFINARRRAPGREQREARDNAESSG